MRINFDVSVNIPSDAASKDTESDLRSTLSEEIQNHLQSFLWDRYSEEDISSRKKDFKVEARSVATA